MHRLLLTGGCGYIGTALARKITSRSDAALTLLGRRSRHELQEQSQTLHRKSLDYRQLDLTEPFEDDLLDGVDCVVHLAGVLRYAGERSLQLNNIVATRQLAQACLRKGTRLIFISTASVYGVPPILKNCFVEEASDLSYCPYAVSKRIAEMEIIEMVELGLNATICRFGQVYGYSHPMQYNTMLHGFLLRACNGQPIRVWQNANRQVRPYLHLLDAVSAIEFLIARPLLGLHIFDCASQNLSTEEVIHRIAVQVPKVSVEFIEPAFRDVDSIELSSESIKALGFEFRGNIDEAIEKIVANTVH
jgi:nucleoside-diphosphate-sugar epimerase